MKRQFFFHGNPSNSESTALDMFNGLEEKIFKDFFSKSPTNDLSPCLVCEIRRWKNSLYSVYSFFCNGRDFSNRPNGHCVLTLIAENYYCRQTYELYQLMELVYEKGLKQGLHYIDDSGKFLINSFYGNDKLDVLQNDFYKRLNESSFIEFDETFNAFQQHENISIYNVEDVDSDIFFSTFKKEGKVFISREVKSNRQILSESHKTVTILQSELNEYKREVEKLRTVAAASTPSKPSGCDDNNKLKQEIKQLQSENRRLEAECGGLRQKKSIIERRNNNNIKNNVSKWMPKIIVILLLINIFGTYKGALDANCFPQQNDSIESLTPNNQTEEQPELYSVAKETKAKIDSLTLGIDSLRHRNDSFEKVIEELASNTSRIDIVPYEKLKLIPNCEINLKVLTDISDLGVFMVDNIEIKDKTFKPTKPGDYTLSWYYNGQLKVKRQVSITQETN